MSTLKEALPDTGFCPAFRFTHATTDAAGTGLPSPSVANCMTTLPESTFSGWPEDAVDVVTVTSFPATSVAGLEEKVIVVTPGAPCARAIETSPRVAARHTARRLRFSL